MIVMKMRMILVIVKKRVNDALSYEVCVTTERMSVTPGLVKIIQALVVAIE